MDEGVQFGDAIFDTSFRLARLGTGESVKFTGTERALLQRFTANVHKLLTRDQLLDAITRAGSESSDRNVDYLINRLRAKLGDSARSPSMIATQYGEGYIWIAAPPNDRAPLDALVVIGPVFGLERLPPASRARAHLLRLQAALSAETADDQVIAIDEGWSADTAGQVRYSLEVSFYDDGTHLHCAAVLRDAVTRQMLRTLRLAFDAAGASVKQMDIESAAAEIKAALWRQATTGQGLLAGPTDGPLELRMHDAARLFLLSDESWMQMGEQLAAARRDDPDDPEANLMWAMHLYTRIVQNPSDIGQRVALESEIETLVFDNMTMLQNNPVFMLGVSKLLLFTGRGHLPLAQQIAEQAFESSAAFASAFATLGQIKMCKGDLGAAIDLYDRGIELSEPKSEFRVYLMVLKCAALLAAGDRPSLDRACAALYEEKPVTRFQIGLPTAPPGPLAPDLDMLVSQFDAARAAQAITYVYYIFARLFEREDHRENIMRGLIGHLVSRFGPDIVSDEVQRCVPHLATRA